MGKQFTVNKGYSGVRYSLSNPKNYNSGDTVVLTDADYAALPSSLTRTVNLGSVTTVAEPVYPASPFGYDQFSAPNGWVDPATANISVSSGVVSNANAVATLAAAAGKTTYITGFSLSALGATAAANVTATITGLKNQLNFEFAFPVGATVAATPLTVTFPEPIPASSVNTAIVVTLPAAGAGNTVAIANAYGFQR